jgi:alpha-ketoglutarate-dependent taurine dioxygenase
MGNCKVLKIYTVSSNETEIHVFKTFINHIGRPDKSVQQAGCDPWAVVLRALI